MNLAEAKIYFPFSEEDDIEELYFERLFEFKQFFTQKSSIATVFNAKLLKLLKMETAFKVISGFEFENRMIPSEKIVFSDDLLESFNEFENQKGRFKLRILAARSGDELHQIVQSWLAVVFDYQQKWAVNCDFEIEIESIAKEPNPMELLSEIRDFDQKGGKTFSDIAKLKSNEFLLKEMKRVSLLFEKINL